MKRARYTDNKNGTVTDNSTGLMWLKDAKDYNDGKPQTWKNAIAGCKKFKFADKKDWRLPTEQELFGIVDFTKSKYPLADKVFIFADVHWFWSSTNYVPSATTAMIVGFGNGYVGDGNKASTYYVRPVRRDL